MGGQGPAADEAALLFALVNEGLRQPGGIPEKVRTWARERGFVSRALTGLRKEGIHLTAGTRHRDVCDLDAFETIYKAISRAITAGEITKEVERLGGEKGTRQRQTIRPDEEARRVPPPLHARASAFSYLQAARANRDKSVLLFRERFLDGDVLTDEQAWAFLLAPENTGIPRGAEDAHFILYNRGTVGPNPLWRADTGGWSCLACVAPGGTAAWAEFRQGSVLGRLQPLVWRLAQESYWWEPDATMFVLTGQPPYIPSLTVQPALTPNAPITIKVMPWVPAEMVADEIRAEQGRLDPDRKRWRLQNYEVLRLVAERSYVEGIDSVDMDTLRAWNEADAAREPGPVRKHYSEDSRGLQRFKQDLRREQADVVLDPDPVRPPWMEEGDYHAIAAPWEPARTAPNLTAISPTARKRHGS